MSIDNVLLSIQQHIPRHPELLRKLVRELERNPSQIETLLNHLRDSESTRLRIKQYVERVFHHKDISYCLIESGIANRTGFTSEIFRKFKHRILPEKADNNALHETLLKISDFKVFTHQQLSDFFAILEIEVDVNKPFLKKELIDGIEVLSYRITAVAIESEFISRFKNNKTVTSFIRQNKEIHALIAQHVLGLQFNPHLVSHIKTLLNDSLNDVATLRRVSSHQGVSLQLTYSLYRITKQIERLNMLLDLYLEPKLSPAQLAQYVKQICENERKKNSVRSLLSETTYLVAYQISEHESKTGEHYIAESRKEYVQMFFSSCIGGIVAVWMAIVKIFLHRLHFAPFWQSFSYSLNYATGFIAIQVFHGTLATKQPAMTAAKIAHSLDAHNQSEKESTRGLALLIAQVARSQFISFVGNLVIVFPVAALSALLWPYLFGVQMVNEHTAHKLLRDVHPFATPSLLYAAITGVMLFVSGIISGYYDNKVIYSNIPARLRQHALLQKILSKRGLIRFSKYVEHNLGSLVGNFTLGFFLGMAGFIGFIFGIPFDIRHITIASGHYTVAVISLFHELDWHYALICLTGVVGIGAFNFLISFSLALFVAIRSRKVKFKEFGALFQIIFFYFRKHPSDFFFAPKQERQITEPEKY